MSRHDHAQLPRQGHRPVHLGIVDAEEVLVRKEDLEGADAIRYDLAKLAFGLVFKLRDRHVEGIVAGAVSLGFGFPELVAFERIVETRRAAHLNLGGGAADQSRDAGGCCVSFAKVAMKGR